jgi:enolase-phosphatase E1
MKYILTDIEGTTSSISFVHETLFPYSYDRMESYVTNNQSLLTEILNTLPGSFSEKIITLKTWIKEDKKEKALKDIQGLIWEAGYKNGEIKGHVYPEVAECLNLWIKKGITLGVYSSGSIHAQKLLFKYSQAGDLDQLFSHNFDTAVGHKREPKSYENILKAININASEVLFLSDIKEELDAAKTCGINTIQLDRLNTLSNTGHTLVNNFSEIKF